MRKTALITGATSGIGASFAKLLAGENHDLVLVARDLERLESRRAELIAFNPEISIEVLSADLATEGGISKVEERIRSGVSVLINNAGFGINKSFTRSTMENERDLLSVLVTTPLRLTHALLNRPSLEGESDEIHERELVIINVSSVASWIAGGTYSASKSYLTVLSESLHTEFARTKVRVLALCPGFTRTEFHQRGRMKMSGLPRFLWMTSDEVAKIGWADAVAGKAISVPGWHYKTLSTIARFAPRPLVRKLGMNLRKKQR